MKNLSFSSMLQQLANDHYNRLINLVDYRDKRRVILDQIDQFYNSVSREADLQNGSDSSITGQVTERNNETNNDTEGATDKRDNPIGLGTTLTFSTEDFTDLDITNSKN